MSFTTASLLAGLLVAALPLCAQFRRPNAQPPRTTPRAVAVLETFEKGPARLYPVSLMLEGKFYDAGLYDSKPVPLALAGDTVYEAQKSGMPVGLFTVQRAGHVQTTWWGEGRWKPFSDEAKSTAKFEDSSKTSNKKDTKVADDPDRPVFHRSTPDKPAEPQVKAAPVVSVPNGQDARQAKAANEDPNRPTLRHGRPASADVEEPLPTPEPASAPGKPLSAGMKPTATYVAVSDAGPYDNRPYEYTANAAEVQHLTDMAARIAENELRKFAAETARKLTGKLALSNVEMHAFDLDYSNSPYVVLSGQYTQLPIPSTAPAGSASRQTVYFIFVIARMDSDGKLNKIFSAATDNLHLDAYSQMELVDAVDVDGDGRGELLLRQASDVQRSYVIYRAEPYRAVKLFEGGSGR